MSKWIMNLGTSKLIILHRATIDMYEVITPCNVHSYDNSVVQAIKMGSIVIEAIYMPKLHTNLLLVSKYMLNKQKIQFNLYECIVKSCDVDAVAIVPRKQNLYKINFIKCIKQERPTWCTFQRKMARSSLVESPWPFDCEGYSYPPNHGEWYEPWQKKNCLRFSLLCKTCIEKNQYKIALPNEKRRRATKPLKIVHSRFCCPIILLPNKGVVIHVEIQRVIFWEFKEFEAFVDMQS